MRRWNLLQRAKWNRALCNRFGVLRMKHIFRKYAFSEHGHLSGVGEKEEREIETTEILIFLS